MSPSEKLNSKLGSFREEEIRRGLRTLRGPRHHSAFTSEISGSANLEPHDPPADRLLPRCTRVQVVDIKRAKLAVLHNFGRGVWIAYVECGGR
jgi:hypothetical protein